MTWGSERLTKIARVGAAAGLLMLGACGGAKDSDPETQPGSIGAAVAVVPSATLATPPGAPRGAQVNGAVFLNDLAATGDGGAMLLRFADASTLSLGANSSATIDRFVFDPARNASTMSVNITKGAFRFVSGPALHTDGEQAPVTTPVATIGVRGTVFSGMIGPEAEAQWKKISPAYRSDGGDNSQGTLIVLDQGAIDIRWSGKEQPLNTSGTAVYFRRPGTDLLGPRPVVPFRREQIDALVAPPALAKATPPATPSPTRSASPTPTTSPSTSPVASPSPSAAPSPTPTATRRPPRPTPSAPATTRPTPRPTLTRPLPTYTPRPLPTRRPYPGITQAPAPSPSATQPTVRPTYTRVPSRPRPSPSQSATQTIQPPR